MYDIGEIIDERYKITDIIGEGGYGSVYKAIDLQNSDELAIKHLNKFQEEDIRRFKREVRIMKNIDHPNVIKVIDSNLDTMIPYFTMPLAKCSLDELIPELHEDINKALDYFEEICKGIAGIHNTGHTHRDIKPHNVLLLEDNKVVVSDLGLAKLNERDTTVLTKASDKILTEDYAPPEQYAHGGTRDLDHRGDIFMLGKTLYHLLTNQRPNVMNPDAPPPGYWYIIQKATQYSPRNRYKSVGQLLDAVQDIRRISDPSNNPDLLLKSLVSTAEEKLKDDQYSQENLLQIMHTLFQFETAEEFINSFDMIPKRLLITLSSDMAGEFEPVIKMLYEHIKLDIRNYPFPYAEKIGNKMNLIYKNAILPSIKRYAVLITLISAVELNRFAAMDQFDNLLLMVEDENDAYAIADGLREELYFYKYMYERVPKNRLHPIIRTVWNQCQEQ